MLLYTEIQWSRNSEYSSEKHVSVGPLPMSRQCQTCGTRCFLGHPSLDKRKGTVPATANPGSAKQRLASELMQFISSLL